LKKEAHGVGDVEVKVTPAVLRQKAAEVSDRIGRVQVLFSELESLIRGTRSYWIGEAGDTHRMEYMEQKDNIAEILRRLQLHPVDLLKISGNYIEGEDEVLGNVSLLQTDAIH